MKEKVGKEAWKDHYSIEQIKKIQKIELENLKVFSDICEKLNINFYLYGGSLLGAIKYSGFVPWDDDLDICLLRKDYEKLILEGPKFLPSNYELQNCRTNKRVPFLYTKFRNIKTSIAEFNFYKIKINHGIYFDIYPLDNLPDDDFLLAKYHKKYNNLAKIFYHRQVPYLDHKCKNFNDFFKLVLVKFRSFILHFVPVSCFNHKIFLISTRYNHSTTKRIGNYNFPKPCNFFNGIEPSLHVNFEHMDMLIPCGYEVNLKNRYGDITQLPPPEKRIGHLFFKIDLGEENFNAN